MEQSQSVAIKQSFWAEVSWAVLTGMQNHGKRRQWKAYTTSSSCLSFNLIEFCNLIVGGSLKRVASRHETAFLGLFHSTWESADLVHAEEGVHLLTCSEPTWGPNRPSVLVWNFMAYLKNKTSKQQLNPPTTPTKRPTQPKTMGEEKQTAESQ